MAKGTRYTPEFKAKAVRLLAESRSSYSSETNAISAVAKDLGIAPESLRRWRNQSDATVAEETRQSAEDAMAELKKLRAENAQLRRANEILTTASAFSRHGSASWNAGSRRGRRTGHTGPRAAGHRNGPKPGITRTKRRKPPHYKSGTKNRPYQCARRHVRTTPSFGYAAR